MSLTCTPTLYEDWQTRRAKLLNDTGPPALAYRDVQLRILDYLLSRYRSEPSAHRPALFPLPKDMIWNRRAQAVHRNLAQQQSGVIRDEDTARARIGPVLARMAAQNAQANLGPPARGALGFGEALKETALSVENRIRRDFSSSFRLLSDVQQTVEACLNAFSALSPERQLVVLRGHYRNVRNSVSGQPADERGGLAPGRVPPGDSFEFLKRCRHPDALGYLFLLWKDALTEVPSEALRDDLEEHFKLDDARVCPPLRFELANADARIRMRAAKLLGRLGTLDDIGLLSDLLALPPQEDEADNERIELAAALEALSKRK